MSGANRGETDPKVLSDHPAAKVRQPRPQGHGRRLGRTGTMPVGLQHGRANAVASIYSIATVPHGKSTRVIMDPATAALRDAGLGLFRKRIRNQVAADLGRLQSDNRLSAQCIVG